MKYILFQYTYTYQVIGSSDEHEVVDFIKRPEGTQLCDLATELQDYIIPALPRHQKDGKVIDIKITDVFVERFHKKLIVKGEPIYKLHTNSERVDRFAYGVNKIASYAGSNINNIKYTSKQAAISDSKSLCIGHQTYYNDEDIYIIKETVTKTIKRKLIKIKREND